MSKPIPQLTYLTNEGITVQNGAPSFEKLDAFKAEGEIRTFKYSPDGSWLAWVHPDCVKIYHAETGELASTLPLKSVIGIEFSPRGTFLSTWERYVKTPDADTNPHKNLLIWKCADGTQMTSFTEKKQSGWNVKWTDDESYFARGATNEVQIQDAKSATFNIINRVKIEGVTDFSISTGKRPIIGAFIPEKNGAPASVRLYDIVGNPTPLAQKTFFRAESAEFHWNKLGTHVLVFTRTDVDKTGQSYYGETNLYFLAIAGNYDCKVELSKPGPIHSVCWSPNSKEFIVVYGSMPSKATLFDHRASVLHDFPTAPRNFVSYNPHGRVICVAGFGSLSSEMELYDRQTLKKLCSIPALNTSSCEWCPDGRYLMSAIVYRKLKVDNCIRLWHYTGVLTHQITAKELYEVAWRPQPASLWPERSALSPAPAVSIPVATIVKPVGVYRPPGARGTATPAAFLNRDSLPAADTPRSNGSSNGYIPGMAPPSDGGGKGGNKNKKKNRKGGEEILPPPVAAPPPLPNIPNPAHIEKEKKIKNINKKLKAIEEIKQKIASGEKLELTQVKKVETEAGLRKELQDLEGQNV
ncbi:eukaryotic translation initiation factor eIF2A-domain-containing protein [Cladochytrium replicatum]|nr:eukaryotic translation initiation factor eIF2A-domain-containing protein [Cladochytrium replicatum]